MQTTLTRRGATAAVAYGTTGVLAAACGTATSTPRSGGVTPGKSATGPVTLDWSSWATDDYGKFREQERIDIWKQLYPDSNISVTMNNFGDYTTKLKTLLAADTGPDVFRLGWSNVFPFMEQGQVAELDPYFRKHPKSWL